MATLLAFFETLDAFLSNIIKPLVILLSLLVAGGMALGIFTRSVLGVPMLGLEEIILFSVVWLYMLGAALASRERSHLSADFVTVFVTHEKLRNSLHLLATLISLVMVIAFVVWSYDLLIWGLTKRQSTPVFQLPLYLSQASLFCASLLFLFYILRDALQDLNRLLRGDH